MVQLKQAWLRPDAEVVLWSDWLTYAPICGNYTAVGPCEPQLAAMLARRGVFRAW